MKKPAFLVSMCLSAGLLFGALPAGAEPDPAAALPQAGHDISPAVNTGWIKKNGVEARVYTDRTKDYPATDTYVGVTGEKKGSGTLYYEIKLWRKTSSGWEEAASTLGSFTSKTDQAKFNIADFMSKGSSGTFQVALKLFKDKYYDEWLGDWTTESFTINH